MKDFGNTLANIILVLLLTALLFTLGMAAFSMSEKERNDWANEFTEMAKTTCMAVVVVLLASFASVVAVFVIRAAKLPGQQLPGGFGGFERWMEQQWGTEEKPPAGWDKKGQ